MDIETLTERLSVTQQVLPSDMQAIFDAGFRGIICNRPDEEAADQPTFETVAQAADQLGIKTCYVPIVPGQVSDQDVIDFGKALAILPGPVLAFCRTGVRSANMWSLCQAKTGAVRTSQ